MGGHLISRPSKARKLVKTGRNTIIWVDGTRFAFDNLENRV